MRYLGSKDALCCEIVTLLREKGLYHEGLSFFDAFCGTGAVANEVKGVYNVIINDSLLSSVYYSKGRLLAGQVDFHNLGVNPFEYLNDSYEILHGFFYKNYSPGGSDRMYFTPENAGRIDYFRKQIEDWKDEGRINNDEYVYLLACLIEAVSKVSNTAGVYGAFLKHWDPRAHLNISILPFPVSPLASPNIECHNDRIENIIEDVNCDIIYLDPPYTQNQYGTQYHILETLVLDDNPTISKVTGSRPVTPMRSNWSKDIYAHILFEKVISKTSAKYIVFSYNNDGFMSKDFIESTMKRFGKEESFECREISYKKYNNFKCVGREGHLEYIFFVEKKDERYQVIESPLNYFGSKAKMVNTLKQAMPNNVESFADVFGGGFNVGINVRSEDTIFNDINPFVVDLIRSFKDIDSYQYLKYVYKKISEYDLRSDNPEGYYALRTKYNSTPIPQRDPKLLYVLILFGFQQQIRFNSALDFNNPCGQRKFNEKLISKFISFSRVVKERNITFENKDFRDVIPSLSPSYFLYLDPPYRETTAAYNDGKRGFEGWTINHENELCSLLESFSQRGGRFIFSYVIDVEGFHNDNIEQWAKKNDFAIIPISESQGRYNNRQEVIIKNY